MANLRLRSVLESYLLILSGVSVPGIVSFSVGVPPLRSVCNSMFPRHHDYTAQTSEAPFQITTSTQDVRGGDNIIITLNGTDGTIFRGFYVQARDENSKPVGTFLPNEQSKTHHCKLGRSNAVFHSDGNKKKDHVTIAWVAPKNYQGEVLFIGTFVRDFVSIWSGVYAEPVTVSFKQGTSNFFNFG